MRTWLLAESSAAVAENPTIPQWAATLIIIAGFVLVLCFFALFLRALRKNKEKTGHY